LRPGASCGFCKLIRPPLSVEDSFRAEALIDWMPGYTEVLPYVISTWPGLSPAEILIPQIESDLDVVAKAFDATSWPEDTLDGTVIALLQTLYVEACDTGIPIADFVSVVRRFGLELEEKS